MTDRKFTPPSEFPAEYVTTDGRKAVILGMMPCDKYPYAGYIVYEDGGCGCREWKKGGAGAGPLSSLHDLPKKQVHWANDYGLDSVSCWYSSRHQADRVADIPSRIAVIRREWVEGQPPQYFAEEV